MKKEKIQNPENNTVGIYGQPYTVSELIHKYGTYEIQPTGETDNEFPTIAQGLPENAKKPTVKPINHSKESQV